MALLVPIEAEIGIRDPHRRVEHRGVMRGLGRGVLAVLGIVKVAQVDVGDRQVWFERERLVVASLGIGVAVTVVLIQSAHNIRVGGVLTQLGRPLELPSIDDILGCSQPSRRSISMQNRDGVIWFELSYERKRPFPKELVWSASRFWRQATQDFFSVLRLETHG